MMLGQRWWCRFSRSPGWTVTSNTRTSSSSCSRRWLAGAATSASKWGGHYVSSASDMRSSSEELRAHDAISAAQFRIIVSMELPYLAGRCVETQPSLDQQQSIGVVGTLSHGLWTLRHSAHAARVGSVRCFPHLPCFRLFSLSAYRPSFRPTTSKRRGR
jgi:hypothetical protein